MLKIAAEILQLLSGVALITGGGDVGGSSEGVSSGPCRVGGFAKHGGGVTGLLHQAVAYELGDAVVHPHVRFQVFPFGMVLEVVDVEALPVLLLAIAIKV